VTNDESSRMYVDVGADPVPRVPYTATEVPGQWSIKLDPSFQKKVLTVERKCSGGSRNVGSMCCGLILLAHSRCLPGSLIKNGGIAIVDDCNASGIQIQCHQILGWKKGSVQNVYPSQSQP